MLADELVEMKSMNSHEHFKLGRGHIALGLISQAGRGPGSPRQKADVNHILMLLAHKSKGTVPWANETCQQVGKCPPMSL